MKWSIYDKDDEIFEEACQMADWMREEEQAKKEQEERLTRERASYQTSTPCPQPQVQEEQKPKKKHGFLLAFAIFFLMMSLTGIFLYEDSSDVLPLCFCVFMTCLFARMWAKRKLK